jgi:hypothetical protein
VQRGSSNTGSSNHKYKQPVNLLPSPADIGRGNLGDPGDGKASLTDLDMEIMRRAESFHNVPKDKGRPTADDVTGTDLETAMEVKREHSLPSSSVQHISDSAIQAEQRWETIVDTCFSGSDVYKIGTEPQNLLMNWWN